MIPSRRHFLAGGAALAVAPRLSAAANLTKVWVQVTGGNYSYLPSLQAMFEDPIFIELEVIPCDHPQTFGNLFPAQPAAAARGGAVAAPPSSTNMTRRGAVGGAPALMVEPRDWAWEPSGGRPHPGFDVQVLIDQLDWPEVSRKNAQRAVEDGRGFVVIHQALGDNQDWPWWREEVTGGFLALNQAGQIKKTAVTSPAALDIRPAGKHPILRDIGPMQLAGEEAYRGMWQSPRITPLLQTASPASDRTVAWIGPHPKARVVCIQPGARRATHRNPEFRKLVRNAVLWCAGRLA
ncbi:MAG: ThuA domain-containing protein [Bryobacteraceae bacterium]